MPFAYVAAAAAVIGAGLSAYGASEQAAAQKNAANYQAQVDAENAKIALAQRSDALQRGELEAQRKMREQAQLIGTQRAALAASGVDVTQGSALDLLASTEFLGQEDVAIIQSNAAREAWGYEIQAGNSGSASNFERWKANQANPTKAGVIAGTSSLLSSASSYALRKS